MISTGLRFSFSEDRNPIYLKLPVSLDLNFLFHAHTLHTLHTTDQYLLPTSGQIQVPILFPPTLGIFQFMSTSLR